MYRCKCGKEFEKKSSLTTHARFCQLYEKVEKNLWMSTNVNVVKNLRRLNH